MPMFVRGGGWRGPGWGPGPWRRPWGHPGGGFVGSLVGGAIGTAIGNALSPPPPRAVIVETPPPAPPVVVGTPDWSEADFTSAMQFIAAAPAGAVVNLTMPQWQAVVSKGMVTYDTNKQPLVMERKIVVPSQ